MGGYTIFFLNPKQWISCFSDSMQLSISSKIYWPQKSSQCTYFNLVANNISKIHYIWKFDAFLGICALTLKIWSLRNIWVIIFYVISQILYLFISIWKFHKFLRLFFTFIPQYSWISRNISYIKIKTVFKKKSGCQLIFPSYFCESTYLNLKHFKKESWANNPFFLVFNQWVLKICETFQY